MEKIKKQVLQRIKDCTAYYPFMASNWEILLTKQKDLTKQSLDNTFGKFKTNSSTPINFYKHISKNIDFKNIENEK